MKVWYQVYCNGLFIDVFPELKEAMFLKASLEKLAECEGLSFKVGICEEVI